MTDVDIRAALDRHWAASAAGDQEAEHEIYQDTALIEYPPSGERIRGRNNVRALRSHHPSKPSGFVVRRITGSGDLWVTEYSILYDGRPVHTVSIMEFEGGKVVRETQYFAEPFEPPSWRAQWVERSM
jgi:SnoaL-like domain